MVSVEPRNLNWLLAALAASLGLNLFIGGFLVGDELRGWHHPPHGAPWERPPHAENQRHIFGFVDHMAATLPEPDRKKFLGVMETYRGELAAADARFHDARDKVRKAIAAEPFDRTALDAAFADVRSSMEEVQKVLHGALADAVSQLPPDARKDLSKWEPGPPGPPREKEHDEDRGEKR